MQEAFLHYIWRYRKCESPHLKLVSGEPLFILHPGQHNQLAGPDFLDARVRIGPTLWAGHVEIHVNASDWYAHRHEVDPAYENVILHVVWDHNLSVIRKDGIPIPTLELKHFVPENLHSSYEVLIRRKTVFISCENEVAHVDPVLIRSWLERLYLKRLQRKVETIQEVLNQTTGNWDAAFFIQLAAGFGTKINKEAFAALAKQIPFRVLCKSRSSLQSLEALLMGTGGLLDTGLDPDPYLMDLRKEFDYLRQKFDLRSGEPERIHFFKLRPVNFPTIRLSQLAGLYYRSAQLLPQCIKAHSLGELHQILRTETSTYWETHYTFGKVSSSRKKFTSYSFINSILINVVLPFKYAYLRSRGSDPWQEVMQVIEEISAERNAIIRHFEQIGLHAGSAMQTQALLEMHSS